MHWPGTIAAGQVSAELVSTMDVSMTMLALAGGTPPAPQVIDGRSLVPLVTSANASSPHEALFHYCGDTLMAVRFQQWKLRYYTEQLPFENYSTVHCTHGWAHSEFFQGGWGCHGGAVTKNEPPELLHLASDPQERYPLLTPARWAAYRRWRQPPPPSSSAGHADCVPNATLSKALAGLVFGGHGSTALPPNSSRAQLDSQCAAHCCAAAAAAPADCVAALVQPVSKGGGQPAGSCQKGAPCCWLVNAEQYAKGAEAEDAGISISVFAAAAPPGPAPPPPIPPQYAEVLAEIERIVAAHEAAMVREVLPPGGAGKADLAPCCNPPSCVCNYPSKNPP